MSKDIIVFNELHNDCNEFDNHLSEIHIKKEIEDSSYEEIMNCFDGFERFELMIPMSLTKKFAITTSDESQSRGESKRSNCLLFNNLIILIILRLR